MARKLKRRELINEEPMGETAKEVVIENEPISFDLKVSGEEIPEVELPSAPEEDEEVTKPKEFKFEFQEEYHLTHNGKDAVIDTLPVEEAPKPRVNIQSLSRAQFRIFQRTGKLPN